MSMTRAQLDALEVELRQLDDVVLVGFRDEGGMLGVLVELGPAGDPEATRADAARIAGQFGDEVHIQVHGGRTRTPGPVPSAARVQLLGVTATPGGRTVEVHLAHGTRRVVVTAAPGDRIGVAAAVVAGLGELGLPVPYEPSAVHLLPDELGGGILALLRHTHLGVLRRGLSGGRWLEEAVARAVLDALNRTLSADLGAVERPMVDLRSA